jgi:hypothetical protein
MSHTTGAGAEGEHAADEPQPKRRRPSRWGKKRPRSEFGGDDASGDEAHRDAGKRSADKQAAGTAPSAVPASGKAGKHKKQAAQQHAGEEAAKAAPQAASKAAAPAQQDQQPGVHASGRPSKAPQKKARKQAAQARKAAPHDSARPAVANAAGTAVIGKRQQREDQMIDEMAASAEVAGSNRKQKQRKGKGQEVDDLDRTLAKRARQIFGLSDGAGSGKVMPVDARWLE